MLAVYVTLTASFVGGACALAFGGDARGRRLLPREVCYRRTGMIIRIGNVDEMGGVHRDLEKVGEAPVAAAQQALVGSQAWSKALQYFRGAAH